MAPALQVQLELGMEVGVVAREQGPAAAMRIWAWVLVMVESERHWAPGQVAVPGLATEAPCAGGLTVQTGKEYRGVAE